MFKWQSHDLTTVQIWMQGLYIFQPIDGVTSYLTTTFKLMVTCSMLNYAVVAQRWQDISAASQVVMLFIVHHTWEAQRVNKSQQLQQDLLIKQAE